MLRRGWQSRHRQRETPAPWPGLSPSLRLGGDVSARQHAELVEFLCEQIIEGHAALLLVGLHLLADLLDGGVHDLLGEVEVTNGGSLGGNKKVNLNFEIITPFPGAGNDRTLRMFSFLDVGNVFGESQPMRLNELRASLGVGISWISPVGPLRLALAYPIRKFTNDKIQRVQFQIGTSF